MSNLLEILLLRYIGTFRHTETNFVNRNGLTESEWQNHCPLYRRCNTGACRSRVLTRCIIYSSAWTSGPVYFLGNITQVIWPQKLACMLFSNRGGGICCMAERDFLPCAQWSSGARHGRLHPTFLWSNFRFSFSHGRRKRGYTGDLTPQLFMWRGYWYVYPYRKT